MVSTGRPWPPLSLSRRQKTRPLIALRLLRVLRHLRIEDGALRDGDLAAGLRHRDAG